MKKSVWARLKIKGVDYEKAIENYDDRCAS